LSGAGMWSFGMAKQQLIVSGASQMPDAVKKLWGLPPILPTADPEVYWKLAAAMFQDIQPANVVELMHLKDIVDDTWEIRELRRHKAQLTTVEEIKFHPKSEKAFATDVGQTYLFLDRLERVEALNKLLESALARRAASLREIGNLKDVLASRLRKASDDAIIDAEFTEHDPGPSVAADNAAVAGTADKPGQAAGDTVPQPDNGAPRREVA
jgi:hypothetical protein